MPTAPGKTTLLKMIVGEYKPTSGTISMAKDLTMGYLNQDHLLSYSSDKSIFALLAMEAFERQNQLHDEIETLLQKTGNRLQRGTTAQIKRQTTRILKCLMVTPLNTRHRKF